MDPEKNLPEPDKFGMIPPHEQAPQPAPEQAPDPVTPPPLTPGTTDSLKYNINNFIYRKEGFVFPHLHEEYYDEYAEEENPLIEEFSRQFERRKEKDSEFDLGPLFVGLEKKYARIVHEKKPEPQPDPYPSRAGWRELFVPPHNPDKSEEAPKKPKGKIGDYNIIESHTTFNDIGGNDRAKGLLQEIAYQFENPELYEKWNVPVPKGVLLYGKPGTGKTMLARAFAGQAGAAFIEVPIADLRDKYYGETEKRLKKVFDDAAAYEKPVVLFFDEINALLPDRSRMDPTHPDARLVEIFLQAVDGLQSAKSIMILGATNHPEKIDSAAKRPGRLDQKIEVELPNKTACQEILAKQLLASERAAQRVMVVDELALDEIGGYLEGLTGSDIEEILKRVKRTMAQTERAMGAGSIALDDTIETIMFGQEERDKLLIATEDILAMAINYQLDRQGISPTTNPRDDEPPATSMR